MHVTVKRFWGNAPKQVSKNYPFTTTIKNIMQVVFSECFVEVEGSGQISIFLAAGIMIRMTNKCLAVLRKRLLL